MHFGIGQAGWRLGILLLCGLAGPVLVQAQAQAQAQAPRAEARPTMIRVVMDDNYPPFIFRDSAGKVQGILVDTWALWEARTGIAVTLRAMDWAKAQQVMQAGEADVIDTIFLTEPRKRLYDFSAPYAKLDVPIFFHQSIGGIVNADSLKGFTVGVKDGDACIDVLRKQGIESMREFISYSSVIAAAGAGEVRVFCVDKPPALYLLNQMGIEKEFRHTLPLYTGEFHRAVRKGNSALLNVVEDGFAGITAAESRQIEQKWYGAAIEGPAAWPYARFAAYVVLAALLVAMALVAWNLALRRNVRAKTTALSNSVEALGDAKRAAEHALAQLSATFAAIPDLLFEMGLDGTYYDFHSSSAESLAAPADVLIGTTVSEVLPADAAEITMSALQEANANGKSRGKQIKLRLPDGERWFELSVARKPVESGKEPRFIVISRDITERKLADLTLQTRENRYRSLVEWSPDAIGVHRGGKLIYVNPAVIRLLGARTAEELLGKPILDFVHPDFHQAVLTRTGDNLARGLNVPMAEMRFFRLDGAVIEVEVQSTPIDFDGTPAIHTVLHDITARKQAEKALGASEARYLTILNASPDNITITDMQGRVRMVSPAGLTMVGYEGDTDVLGRPITDFLVAGDRDRALAHISRLYKGIPSSPDEYRGLRRDGSTFDVEANFDFIRDSNGQPDGMVFVIRDITERKAAEVKMLRVSRLYEALSECNQAIVRCSSDAELFPQICIDAVKFGGMKMACIGLVDEGSRQIRSVASFGDGTDYLRDVNVTVNAEEARGRGPTGTAIRENRAVWCQDFHDDPLTAPWQERAASVGWAASAALPLHRFGVVIGALTIYAGEVNAFDADVRKLLQDMALDISFALDSYARDAARKTAEEALRESEAFNLAILDSVTAEIAVLDGNGVIIAVNQPWRRFGQENGAEAGQAGPHADVGANYLAASRTADGGMGDDARAACEGIEAVLAGRLPKFRMEYACHSPQAQRWFSMNVTPFGLLGRGAVVAHADITKRKISELVLQQTNERFRNLVDSTDGIVWEADATTFVFSFVSSNAERLLGYPVEDWLQPGFWASHIHPDDRDQAVQYCAACTGRIEDHEFEYRFIARDGRAVWMTDIVKVIADAGKPHWLRGLMVDITERKRAETEVRARSRAMEQSPASIVITDREGTIEYVNPRFEDVTGYSSAEAVGGNPRMLQSAMTPPEVYRQMWAVITAGGEWRGELCNRRKNGELFWEFVAISGITDEKGEIERYIAVKEDITERKRAEVAHAELEAQLRESQKMQAIGTLAGGIAHDFNNILATILGNTELARQDIGPDSQARESLREIDKAASRARDLVQQILSFSRRQPTRLTLLSLAPVVEESVRLLRATLPARIVIEKQVDAALPAVLADANQIQQVLINLGTNAIQAMPELPGRIAIRLDTVMLDAAMADAEPALRALYERRPGLTVRLIVSDDGMGMDADTLGRVFEPFFTTKPVGEGTGLGLSVVHGIVKAHEGVIVADSQAGKGAQFTIYLPVAEHQAAAPTPDVAAAAQAPNVRGSKHILYIDDDESLVFLVKRLMQRQDYVVSGFTDQREALDALRANPAAFDLVVTDYNMPGMSGLDVAREVRAIRADLPVAVASGFIDETLRAQAAGAGVRELIFKANAVEDLCDAFVRLAQAAWDESNDG
ncbi:MAG: PAS domain S-box protein [Betaproteobacteria bacterium]